MKKLSIPMLNSVQLSGRVTKDPEIKYSVNNIMVAKSSLAFEKLKKDEYGNYQRVANFITLTAFGKNAETFNEKVPKGTPVIIDGELSVNSYVNSDGKNVRDYEILVNRVHVLEREVLDNGIFDDNKKPDSNNVKEDVPF